MLYQTLNARNPDPEHAPEFLQELQDLYEGGYSILRRAEKYLPKLLGEDDRRWRERLAISSYISYLGQIVDTYTANLFAQELAVQPAGDASDPNTPGALPDADYWPKFSANADLKGSTFANVVRGAFSSALVKRCAYVALDFPSTGIKPSTLAEEEAAGNARGYAFEVPREQILDWCYDEVVRRRVPLASGSNDQVEFEVGRFAWVVLKRTREERATVESDRGSKVDEFKVWRRDPSTSQVVWERYETRPYTDATPIQGKEEVQLVASDTTSFREIPLIELRLPYGLWVGNKVGPLNKEHYRRRSTLIEAMQLSLYEIPIAFLDSEIGPPGGAMPSEAQQNPNRADDMVANMRAQGVRVLGGGDKFGYYGPSGTAYEPTDKQLGGLVDEMHRTAHQMAASVSSTSSAVGRSGASKAEDRHASLIILGAYGAIVRDFARRLYNALSDARVENVIWDTKGLDKFDLWDRTEMLAEALAVNGVIQQIGSRTLATNYKTYVAQRLVPNTPAETFQQIQREIDAATTDASVSPPQANGDASGVQTAVNGAAMTGGDVSAASIMRAGTAAAAQGAPTKPGDSPAPTTKQAASGGNAATSGGKASAAAPAQVQPQQAAPAFQRGETSAGIAETVYAQLAEDYPPESIQWVRATSWAGPQLVPLDQVDFSNKASWTATKNQGHVDDFIKQLAKDGQTKAVILVNEPNNERYIIIDGHHRSLAYQQLNQPVWAYIGTVGAVNGPWDALHASQKGGNDRSLQSRQLDSTQLVSLQQSMQKPQV